MERRILCFGDSNTWGYDVKTDSRFPASIRWTCQLQALLPEYQILEEGLCGRTTVFADPLNEGMRGIDYLKPCLCTHSPLHALLLALGTNDCKERFSATAKNIADGMQRLIQAAKQAAVWTDQPNILVIAPPPMPKELSLGCFSGEMGDCSEKSYLLAKYYQAAALREGCQFLDLNGIAEMSQLDHMHYTAASMPKIAAAIAKIIKNTF